MGGGDRARGGDERKERAAEASERYLQYGLRTVEYLPSLAIFAVESLRDKATAGARYCTSF